MFNPILERLDPYPTSTLQLWREEARARGLTVWDLGVGDPPTLLHPGARAAFLDAVPTAASYPRQGPAVAARAAAAGFLRRRYGAQLDPEAQVVLTTGSKEASVLVPLLAVDRDSPRRGVLVPVPGYAAALRGAVLAGAELIPVPLQPPHFTPRVWELPEAVLSRAAVLWINSPHNPTGAVMSREDLARTAAVCGERGILLASDELYADLYQGEPPAGVLEVAERGVLAVHSLSKRAGFTALGAGCVAGAAEVIARYRKLRDAYGAAPSDMVNAAAAVAWADDAHPAEARQVHARRRAALQEGLEALGLEVLRTGATFYLWVRAPAPHDGLSWARALAARGVLVQAGAWFGALGEARRWVRFAAVLEDYQQALAVIQGELEA
ncbi:MAG: aminotransferase class I/II-fold pyridoxal phosphate-dependent enzyme [Deltaproteobacteria bacterium]|nr:aminotransferase class I/II-fold pyridoxal phosphate-dependent enzyme [Deltaproteobacteria bacterium]